MSERSIESLQRDLDSLAQMISSRGWEIFMEATKQSVLEASLAMAGDPNMPEKEVDFRRGAIHTANNLLNVGQSLVMRAENALLMAQASQPAPQLPTATA